MRRALEATAHVKLHSSRGKRGRGTGGTMDTFPKQLKSPEAEKGQWL
jgi:hypothetical protein